MITAHLLCVKSSDWQAEVRSGITYCTCGCPLTDETREHAQILHQLLFPSVYNTGGSALSTESS